MPIFVFVLAPDALGAWFSLSVLIFALGKMFVEILQSLG